MPIAEFENIYTQEVVKGINFGGSNQKVYHVGDTLVYAPNGGTSIGYANSEYTLNPLGLISSGGSVDWTIQSYQYNGDGTWYVTLENIFTGDTISNVLPFNESGSFYTTHCDSVDVLANCGGYKVEDTWVGQDLAKDWKRLVHTDSSLPHEILKYNENFGDTPSPTPDGETITGSQSFERFTGATVGAFDYKQWSGNSQCTGAYGDNNRYFYLVKSVHVRLFSNNTYTVWQTTPAPYAGIFLHTSNLGIVYHGGVYGLSGVCSPLAEYNTAWDNYNFYPNYNAYISGRSRV
jgi:hypothetical protein